MSDHEPIATQKRVAATAEATSVGVSLDETRVSAVRPARYTSWRYQ